MSSRFTRTARLPVVLAVALAPLATMAQPPADTPENRAKMAQMVAADFKAADKNGDGALTRAEAEAGMPQLAPRFDAIDTAKTGKISLEQIRGFLQKQMQERRDPPK